MIEATKTGGPAFPTNFDMSTFTHENQGMTKREFIAIEAMKGLLSNPGGPFQANTQTGWGLCNCDYQNVVDECLCIADTMLESLK